jgi:hypothetical protein
MLYSEKSEWSEGFYNRQTVNYGHESCRIQNEESLCWQGTAAI